MIFRSQVWENLPVLQLTLAEIEKKERRKEQNRRAARKCRIKKRAHNVTMASVSFTFLLKSAQLTSLCLLFFPRILYVKGQCNAVTVKIKAHKIQTGIQWYHWMNHNEWDSNQSNDVPNRRCLRANKFRKPRINRTCLINIVEFSFMMWLRILSHEWQRYFQHFSFCCRSLRS